MQTAKTIRAVPSSREGNVAESPMQGFKHRPKRFNILSLLKGETIVNSHTTDGSPAVIRVPHTLLATFMALTLALVSGGYWLVSSLTALNVKIDGIAKDQSRIDRQLETQKAYIDAETNQVKFMQGLMTREQQRAVTEYERSNPKPKLPEAEQQN